MLLNEQGLRIVNDRGVFFISCYVHDLYLHFNSKSIFMFYYKYIHSYIVSDHS